MKKLFIATLCTAVLVGAFAIVQVYRSGLKSKALLQKAATIRLSPNVVADIKAIADELQLPIQYFGSCNQHCIVSVAVTNGWLGRIGVMKFSQVIVTGGTFPRDKSPSGVEMTFGVSIGTNLQRGGLDYSSVHIDQCSCDSEIQVPVIREVLDESGNAKRVMVRLGMLPMRPEYFELNTTC